MTKNLFNDLIQEMRPFKSLGLVNFVPMTPNEEPTQVGGTHYTDMAIQPIEFIEANKLGFMEGNIIKYAARHKAKNGAEDIRKIIHYAKLILKYQYGEE